MTDIAEPVSSIHDKEEEFHDRWAESIDLDEILVDESFTAETAFENRFCLTQMGDLAGRKILDLGCGAGEAAVYFAKKGAHVVATDLSAGMLDVAARLAEMHGCSIETIKAPAEDLPLDDESFDIVYGANVLHHVDIAKALDETRRILRPNGLGLFIEPLTYNPVINVYRRLADTVRTVDEHPLRLRDLRLFEERFARVEHRETWLCTLYLFIWFFLVERAHPSRVRYWKKAIRDSHKHRAGIGVAQKLDNLLLTALPFLRFWCWNTVVCVRK
ncbi:MAG: class I SAM-dependent methyltransferase [Verrucomicrobia bacterium]|nr:class I SAM-dependent methyltransferase [Verrucomicrobiota bacterium]MDA1086876.1 class I SAM-dependent methyltransferase [Verrucomicrobiota bacterium]